MPGTKEYSKRIKRSLFGNNSENLESYSYGDEYGNLFVNGRANRIEKYDNILSVQKIKWVVLSDKIGKNKWRVDNESYWIKNKSNPYLTEEISIQGSVVSINENLNDNHYIFDIPNKSSGQNNLAQILSEIEKSKYVLSLKDNWDDEGSIGYSIETWSKATNFLLKFYRWAFITTSIEIPSPKIYHGPNGSIDLLWKNQKIRLLLNLKPNENFATYYGDDYELKKFFVEDAIDVTLLEEKSFQLISIAYLLNKFT